MRHFRPGILLCVTLLCAACEFHVGDGDFDANFDWDDDDAGADRRDGSVTSPDDDGGATTTSDAAVSDAQVEHDASHTGDAGIDAGDPPTDTPLTVDDVATVFARGSCGALEDCMGRTLLLDSLDGKDCVGYRTQVYANRELYWLKKSVALGRVTFRADFLSACERDLIARGCDVQSRRMPSSCEDALEGKTDIDGACAIDQECEGSMYCDKGMLETCPGWCTESKNRAGLSCNSSSQCPDGQICRGQVCKDPLSEGDDCGVLHGYGECPPGLVCQSVGTSSDLTCQSIESVHVGKLGDACGANGKLCAGSLVCQIQTTPDVAGKCAATVGASATCRRSFPNQCPVDQYCKDARANVADRAPFGKDGVCSALPGDGQGCDTGIGCKPGAVCVADDEMCHALKTVGASCEYNQECYGGSCQDGRCAAPLDCSGG